MKRIGVTQRVVYEKDIDERRDMLDQRWYNFAKKIDVELIPIPNNPDGCTTYVNTLGITGIIFSGGNNIGISGKELIKGKTMQDHDVAYERDRTELALIRWATANSIPVIGVCRGMQLINAYFKGEQMPVEAGVHVAKKHEVTFFSKKWQVLYGNQSLVNSYHRWGITQNSLAKELLPTALYKNDEVEAFEHTSKKISGIMWHPERYERFRTGDINFFKKKLTEYEQI